MIDIDSLNFNSVETLPGFEARAAFTVNSVSVFKEDIDIVPIIGLYNLNLSRGIMSLSNSRCKSYR